MKTIAIAAIATLAAAQEPTAGVKDASNVWSEDDLATWAAANFDGKEWDAFDFELMSEEARHEMAMGFIGKLVEAWTGSIGGLPSVCEPGLICRQKHFQDLLDMLAAEWSATLNAIDVQFQAGKNYANGIAETALKAAYDCEDGCYCE